MQSDNEIRSVLKQAFGESALPLPRREAGKVRDGYPLDRERRLLVTTDRLSAFDRVLACVPFKGQVLNQLSAWWFEQTADVIQNHMLAVPDPNALVARQAAPFSSKSWCGDTSPAQRRPHCGTATRWASARSMAIVFRRA